MKINEFRIRDPFILPYNGVYYLYGTRGYKAEGFDVRTSRDLVEWSEPKEIFVPTDGFWGKYDYWAPEVHLYKGKFYMFAGFKSDDHRRGTHILVCDSPDGRFQPLTDEPCTPRDWECLDGTLYVDESGKPFAIYCHEWLQCHDGEMCVQELSDDLKTPVGKPTVLFRASELPGVRSVRDESNFVTDGPFIVRLSHGRLLMLWSSFGKDGYIEAQTVNDSGNITGGWQLTSERLFEKDGGHGMVFTAFDGRRYFIMHSPNTDGLERAVLFPVEEKEGFLRIVK